MIEKDTQNIMIDDQIAAVQIGGGEVRGRVLRLGSSLDVVLGGNRYPLAVANLLGEAVMISALVASSLKFKGRFLVQAHGTNEGAVSMLAAECTTDGNMRAYARFDAPSLERILAKNDRPDAKTLTGGGSFAMTIDPGSGKDRYQGISAIEGATLAACAEHFFKQSEQVPTRIKLAVGRLQLPGQAQEWRGGGIMVQRVAADLARGDAEDAWDMSKALMGTLKDEELLDPDLGSERLLYRLFHEQGVRMDTPMDLRAQCSCSRERLLASIKTFEAAQRQDMFEDGKITASCEFCAADYVFTPQDVID
ncbi:MAG: Hsp33 family molecular chaperone HslO [Robiginitomaculum sp.]|nr:Hsp33 family molecular chaperone HslO [Robiginitomaculum sp.]MCF6274275.1 Hsp33 family molecular chaperone HslO [Robiginitomaculum sp.]